MFNTATYLDNAQFAAQTEDPAHYYISAEQPTDSEQENKITDPIEENEQLLATEEKEKDLCKCCRIVSGIALGSAFCTFIISIVVLSCIEL